VALTGVIVTEVLQGLTRDARAIEQFLRQFDMLEPGGFETYRAAAAIYRTARGKGISPITIDTLIAAIALEYGACVFTLDRDFSRIALIAHLALYRF
jgi:predicted nucleic acid-binding protein